MDVAQFFPQIESFHNLIDVIFEYDYAHFGSHEPKIKLLCLYAYDMDGHNPWKSELLMC